MDGSGRVDGDDGRVPDGDAAGPDWRQGIRAAVVALGVVLILQGLVPILSGDRPGPEQPADGSLSFFAGIGGWPLVAAAVAFVLFSRAWRLLRRQG